MPEAGRLDISSDSLVHVRDGQDALLVIRPKEALRLELRIGKGCHVETYVIQESEVSIQKHNLIGEGSVLKSHCLWLCGGDGKVVSRLEGDRSEAHDTHIFVSGGSDRLHLDSSLQHVGKDTRGGILVRGVVKDSADARLDGMIRVDKQASGAESSLIEDVMLLNLGAKATATPDMEILNSDVSSSHAATVSQIDGKQIFYLTSRGMSQADARKLIVEGFLDSCVGRISDDDMRREFSGKALSSL